LKIWRFEVKQVEVAWPSQQMGIIHKKNIKKAGITGLKSHSGDSNPRPVSSSPDETALIKEVQQYSQKKHKKSRDNRPEEPLRGLEPPTRLVIA
jgi:hypothetical protein